MSGSPKISVIVTCYNFAHFIRQAIESIQSQSIKDVEIIVIDDGSQDESPKIIKELAKSDSRLRLFLHRINRGISYVLNEGLRHSRARYVAIMDGDDYWLASDKLKRQYDFLEANKDYVLVGAGVKHMNNDGELLYYSSRLTEDEEIRKKMLSSNYFGHSALLFKRDAAIKVGGYPVRKLNQDYELCLRLGKLGKIANMRTFDICHRITGKNTMFKHLLAIHLGRLKLIWKFRHDYRGCIYGIFGVFTEFVARYLPSRFKQRFKRVLLPSSHRR